MTPPEPSQAQKGTELQHSLACLVGGAANKKKGVPKWVSPSLGIFLEDGWRCRSVLPMSSSAFGEVTALQGAPEIATLYTKLQPQCLGMAKIC